MFSTHIGCWENRGTTTIYVVSRTSEMSNSISAVKMNFLFYVFACVFFLLHIPFLFLYYYFRLLLVKSTTIFTYCLYVNVHLFSALIIFVGLLQYDSHYDERIDICFHFYSIFSIFCHVTWHTDEKTFCYYYRLVVGGG